MKTAARNIFSWCKTQRLDYHGGPQGQKRRTAHRNLGYLTPPTYCSALDFLLAR
jgi:hypothetical protein